MAVKSLAGSTYRFQAGLRRLPVPELKDTLTRYLATVQPLVSPAEYAHTQGIVKAFAESARAKELHDALTRRAQSEANWLERWWDEDVYLRPRLALPVNYNYFLMLARDAAIPPAAAHSTAWLARGARLVRAMMQFRVQLNQQALEPDRDGGEAVCMSQFTRLFSHARVAKPDVDEIHCYDPRVELPHMHFATQYRTRDAGPEHVLVMCGGHMFTVPVADAAGALRPASALAHDFAGIVAAVKQCGACAHPVGALTSLPRDAWASIRARLEGRSAHNRASLAAIDQAVWVVNLDTEHVAVAPSVVGPASAQLTADSPRFLLGHADASNSWFDKHQLLIAQSGNAGVLMEHSPGDGMTAMRMLEYMHAVTHSSVSVADRSAALQQQAAPSDADMEVGEVKTSPLGPHVKPLAWELSPADYTDIASARSKMRDVSSGLSTHVLAFDSFGGADVKRMQLPPDAFAQMALQLAHARLYGGAAATYESTSTRAFLHGRTETTRTCSLQSQAFVSLMTSTPLPVSSTDAAARAAALEAACRAHTSYARIAKAGHGVDRMLTGLRTLATQDGADVPAIFTDPSYARSRHWRLSTSHCGSKATALFGFGPVVDDGYGVGYFITPQGMAFNITGSRTHPLVDTAALQHSLHQALHACAEVGQYHATHYERIHGKPAPRTRVGV